MKMPFLYQGLLNKEASDPFGGPQPKLFWLYRAVGSAIMPVSLF